MDRAPAPLRLGANQQRDALLSEAREARELRDRERKQRVHVLVIQRCTRRWLGLRHARQDLRQDLRKKLGDLEKLRSVLAMRSASSSSSSSSAAAAAAISFSPPLAASTALLRQYLLCGCHSSRCVKSKDGKNCSGGGADGATGKGRKEEQQQQQQQQEEQMLISLCRLILLTGFEGGKLSDALLDGHRLMLEKLVGVLLAHVEGIDYENAMDPLAIVLETLTALCKRLATLQAQPPASAAAAAATAATATAAAARQFQADILLPQLFPALRKACLAHDTMFAFPSKSKRGATLYMSINNKNKGSSGSGSSSSPPSPFALLFRLVEVVLLEGAREEEDRDRHQQHGKTPRRSPSSSPSPPSQIFSAYVYSLLSLPLFARQSAIDHTPFLGPLVKAWEDFSSSFSSLLLPSLPPSPYPAASSLVWLLSNVSYVLASALPTIMAHARSHTHTQEREEEEDKQKQQQHIWREGLRVFTSFLQDVPPSIVGDIGIISFEKKGTHTHTHTVDPLIIASLQLCLKEETIRTLILWVLGVGGFDHKQGISFLKHTQRQEEKEQVRLALHTTALDLTYASQQQQQALKSASWFSKLSRRFWRGGGGGGGRATGRGAAAAAAATTGEEDEREGNNHMEMAEESSSLLPPPSSSPSFSLYTEDPTLTAYPLLTTFSHFGATLLWKCHSMEASPHTHAHTHTGSSSTTTMTVPIKRQFLSTAAFSGPTTARLWIHLLTCYRKEIEHIDRVSFISSSSSALGLGGGGGGGNGSFLATLAVFASVCQHELVVVSDEEMQSKGVPLALPHVVRLIKLLKVLCFRGCVAYAEQQERQQQEKATTTTNKHTQTQQQQQQQQQQVTNIPYDRFLLVTFCRLLRLLYDRWSRKAFCTAEVWELEEGQSRRVRKAIQDQTALGKLLLQTIPFIVPFSERHALFRQWVATEKRMFQSEDKRPLVVKIRRGFVLEDGLSMLNNLRESIKRRIVVIYISAAGMQESGIDGGGLFKEFLTEFCALVFEPSFGLFTANRGGFLYPNPCSQMLHSSSLSSYDHTVLFEHIGKLLGKAVYESIVIAPLFLPVLLGYLKGQYNYMNMLSDLRDMDEDLYKNLHFLRQVGEDSAALQELGLCFAVTHHDLGTQREQDLIPGGSEVPVTVANRHHYIHLVAKHHVVDRLAVQSQAFLRGFHQVISPTFLSIFSEAELQLLISGCTTGKIDLQDLAAHTRYAQGYRSMDRHIKMLWSVLGELTDQELGKFLHFVTSNSRAPVGGFGNLVPPFTVVRVPIARDEDRLPSARTCFNSLHWPTFPNKSEAKKKLLLAINSGAGFELS